MIKICSLDFLNRNSLETDIMSEDGKVLLKKGDSITPEMLLKFYFKDIYVDRWPLDEEELTEIESTTQEELNINEIAELVEPAVVTTIEENSDLEIPLEFDETEAQNVARYASKIGLEIGFSGNKIKDLEKAAYYHKIGIIKFKKIDLLDKNFEKNLAEASYDTLINEMKFPEQIAEAARFYNRKYDITHFRLNKENLTDIPYSHIVAIASFYNKLRGIGQSKENALARMLQVGGNRFNIFILHKFINIMRNSKDEN